MKQGFNGRDAYNMYRSLAKEVINNYGDRFAVWKAPVFKSESCSTTKPSAINFTHSIDPGLLAMVNFERDILSADYMKPKSMIICKDFMSVLYEEELIGILLHELGHVMVGCMAAHGSDWRMFVAELGGVDEEYFIPKAWEQLPDHVMNKSKIPEYIEMIGEPFYSRN